MSINFQFPSCQKWLQDIVTCGIEFCLLHADMVKSERTGLPSTAAARATAVLITSIQTLGEKRQYSDTRKAAATSRKMEKEYS